MRSGEDVGRAIGEIRRARGLTPAQLAIQSGLSWTWLAKTSPAGLRWCSSRLQDKVLLVRTGITS